MHKSSRLAFSAAMLLIGGGLLAYSYIWGAEFSAGEEFGPMFYPRFILWLWVLLGAGLVVECRITQAEDTAAINKRSLLISVLSVTGACVLLEYLGFLLTCVLFCCVYPLALGYRRTAVAILSAVGFSVATWYVFNSILLIVLPEGFWG